MNSFQPIIDGVVYASLIIAFILFVLIQQKRGCKTNENKEEINPPGLFVIIVFCFFVVMQLRMLRMDYFFPQIRQYNYRLYQGSFLLTLSIAGLVYLLYSYIKALILNRKLKDIGDS